MIEINKIYNADCLELMKDIPDKSIDLVLTDPPYGGGGGRTNISTGSEEFLTNIVCKRTGGTWSKKYQKGGIFENTDISYWDFAPTKEYFDEMFRISKNQIIWGGNYFSLPPTRCFLVWNKFIPENFSMAMCEYAWTSFNQNAKSYKIKSSEKLRFHPTQKPLKLIEWCISRYSKEGDLVLDCFSGSGTTAIACHNLKRNFICIEKDYDYWKASVERLEIAQAQMRLPL